MTFGNWFLPADQTLICLLGVGHPLMDRAIQESADQQVFLTRVKGIDTPVLIALIEDEVTGTGATVHRVILGIEGAQGGHPVVLRDWELLLRLIAFEPLSECGHARPPRADPVPPCALDASIRAVLATSDHPVARAALAAQKRLPWGSNPVEDLTEHSIAAMIIVATLM